MIKEHMDKKTEDTVSVIAALVILFAAMFDPRVAMTMGVSMVIGLGSYHLMKGKE